MPKSTSNSFCANETLLRSRNAITYISSRNGISRRKTFLVAASLRSWRRRATSTGLVSDIVVLSMHVLATVDLDRCAVDVAPVVGEQERDRGRDLRRLAHPTEWDPGGH